MIASEKYMQKDIHITPFYIKNVAPLKKTNSAYKGYVVRHLYICTV